MVGGWFCTHALLAVLAATNHQVTGTQAALCHPTAGPNPGTTGDSEAPSQLRAQRWVRPHPLGEVGLLREIFALQSHLEGEKNKQTNKPQTATLF